MNNGWIGVSPRWLQIKKEALGLSFKKMGDVCGIDRRNLHKYYWGQLVMSNDTKKKIYNAFKLYENGK